jgi:sugar phosphate permease
MAPEPSMSATADILPAGSRVDVPAKMIRVTATLLFLGGLVNYIDRLVITLALPFIGQEFLLNKAEQGLILTVFFITYGVVQIPGGLLVDWIGARKSMVAAMVGWSIFTGLTAVAFSYSVLLVIRTLFGVCEGIYPAAFRKAVVERTNPEQRLTVNGFVECSNGFGAALAPLIAGPAIAYIGWRHSFFLIAVLGFAMAVAIGFYLPRPRAGAGSGTGVPVRPSFDASAVKKLLSSRSMWLVAAAFCGLDSVSWGLISWTPSYLMEVRHLNVRSSGFLTSIPFFVGGCTTVLGGILFDKVFHGNPRLLIVPVMAVAGVFLWLMSQATSVHDFILFEAVVYGLGQLCFMPIYGLPMRFLPVELAGVGTSMVNFGGQFAGVVTPFVMGALADAFSFKVAFSFLIFGVGLTIVAAALTPQRKERFMAAVA